MERLKRGPEKCFAFCPDNCTLKTEYRAKHHRLKLTNEDIRGQSLRRKALEEKEN